MPIDWGAIVAQTPSIALALVFAWFAVTLIQGQREHSDRVMDEWSKRLAQRDTDWQKFIDDQRRQMYDATGRLAEEIKEIARQVAALNALMTSHDRSVQAATSDLMREVTKPRTRGKTE